MLYGATKKLLNLINNIIYNLAAAAMAAADGADGAVCFLLA